MGQYSDDVLRSMFGKLNSSISDLNCNLVKMSQKKIPVYYNAYNSTNSDVSLRVKPNIRNAVMVTSLVATCTSNATLQIKDHLIPITSAQSPVNLHGLRWIVNEGDFVGITQTTTGAMSMEIFGEDLGDTGVM